MAKTSMGYSTIPSIEENGSVEDLPTHRSTSSLSWFTRRRIIIILIHLAVAAWIVAKIVSKSSALDSIPLADKTFLPLPKGVNLASWLSLEDYFFVGANGSVEVATFEGSIVAQCLPPLHVDSSTGPMWNSETDLFKSLMEKGSVRSAIKTFQAFRTSYLDFDKELLQIANLGVKRVRVPLSWCLSNFDPDKDTILKNIGDSGDDGVLLERYACRDPFFEKDGDLVYWPAVPKTFLQQFLRACSKYGIKATLDIHTYAGGTSLGTFSGVWPKKPLFWKYDDPENTNLDFGRTIYNDFLKWIESMADSDPEAFAGIGAITPMNEPAHLAGLFGPGSTAPDEESYLPPLPPHVAARYLKKLNKQVDASSLYMEIPDGPHLRSLLWQDDAVASFRKTSLPSRGIEMYVNVHESVLVQSIVGNDPTDPGGRHPQGTALFLSWWREITTTNERASWAVLDMHHYHAWEPACQGAVDGPPQGNYTCGNMEATNEALTRCASWAQMYRDTADEQLGGAKPARLASAEFSSSTHHSVRHSCLDTTTLELSYRRQVDAANDAKVELYWWGWKMPYGGSFRRAWSFKHFLHLLGVDGFSDPDASEIPCGGPR